MPLGISDSNSEIPKISSDSEDFKSSDITTLGSSSTLEPDTFDYTFIIKTEPDIGEDVIMEDQFGRQETTENSDSLIRMNEEQNRGREILNLNNTNTYAKSPTKHRCDICNKHFAAASSLRNHTARLHSTEQQPYACEHCGKPFNRRDHLERHVRTHTGEKPFPCTLCDFAFSDRSALKVHLRVHSGEKPYNCDVCGKTFSTSSNKRSHMSRICGFPSTNK